MNVVVSLVVVIVLVVDFVVSSALGMIFVIAGVVRVASYSKLSSQTHQIINFWIH